MNKHLLVLPALLFYPPTFKPISMLIKLKKFRVKKKMQVTST